MLKDFGHIYSGGTFYVPTFHMISNGKYRLSIVRTKNTSPITYETEIYSLPGNPPSDISSPRVISYQSPFPNPANSIITLPYQLRQGEMSVMHIFNLNGQLIEKKQVDSIFDKILLNVSNYVKGTYLYEVNGVSKKFIVD